MTPGPKTTRQTAKIGDSIRWNTSRGSETGVVMSKTDRHIVVQQKALVQYDRIVEVVPQTHEDIPYFITFMFQDSQGQGQRLGTCVSQVPQEIRTLDHLLQIRADLVASGFPDAAVLSWRKLDLD